MIRATSGQDGVSLGQLRDDLYRQLPASGRKAQGALALWALGVPGVSGEELDKVITHERVQWELKQSPVDAVGLSDAVSSAAAETGGWKIYDALHQPREKLLLIMAIR